MPVDVGLNKEPPALPFFFFSFLFWVADLIWGRDDVE
jgi:hypothetical protein